MLPGLAVVWGRKQLWRYNRRRYSIEQLYVSRNGHESGRIKALEKEFIETFTKEMGTIDCSDLKAKYRNDEIKCNLVIFKAGEILDRIVEREGLN